MPPFRPRDLSEQRRLDWRMLRFGWVTLFRQEAVLDRTLEWLRGEGYREIRMDARPGRTEADMYESVTNALGLPGPCGNFDGLDDWLYDFIEGHYGADPDAAATSIAILGFDSFVRTDPRAAGDLLELLGRHAAHALMFGHRLLILVQSNDPDIELGPVGGREPYWNEAEWLNASRHP